MGLFYLCEYTVYSLGSPLYCCFFAYVYRSFLCNMILIKPFFCSPSLALSKIWQKHLDLSCFACAKGTSWEGYVLDICHGAMAALQNIGRRFLQFTTGKENYKIKFSGKGLCILHGYQFLFFNLRTPRVLEILCIHNVTQKTKKGWCNITQIDVFYFFHVRNEIASTLQFWLCYKARTRKKTKCTMYIGQTQGCSQE